MKASKCDKCGEIVQDIDAGFSPGLHEMGHGGGCGGTWRVIDLAEQHRADAYDAAQPLNRGDYE